MTLLATTPQRIGPTMVAKQLRPSVFIQPPARPRRRLSVQVGANLETQHLFASRVGAAGYQVPRMQGLHPIAQEAWASIHAIYGAQCFETPLVPAPWLADLADAAAVHLKAENKQPGGSYRLRGAAHKLLGLSDDQLQRGITAAGSVNHTLAVLHAAAAAAKQRGIRVPARVFLPRGAGAARAERLRALGGTVEEDGSEAEAVAAARAAAGREGQFYVDAYNDTQVAGGLGSIAIELLMQLPRGRMDAVFVPMSGGGLASGIAAVLKAANPSIRIVACRPRTVDRLRGVLTAPPAVADGTEATAAAEELVDEVVEVGEEEVARAVVDTTSHSGMQVDAATGVAVAAFQRVARSYGGKHVVILVVGGNIGTEDLEKVYRVAGPGRAMGRSAAAS